jgi:hypothetical protein
VFRLAEQQQQQTIFLSSCQGARGDEEKGTSWTAVDALTLRKSKTHSNRERSNDIFSRMEEVPENASTRLSLCNSVLPAGMEHIDSVQWVAIGSER